MADEQKPEGQGIQPNPNGEGKQPETTPVEGKGTQPEGGSQGGDSVEKTAVDEKKPDEGVDKKEKIDDEEPPVRQKSPLQYILDRKNRQIEKLKSKDSKTKESEKKSENVEGDDEGITPEDEGLVMKVLDKHLGGKFAADAEKELQGEVRDFVAQKPQFKPFEAKIQKWAKNPAYSNLPIEQVAYAACGASLLQLGAQQKIEADKKADTSGTGGGGSARPAGGTKDWRNASIQETEAEIQRVTQGVA